jgi:predicted amidohydrolase YtcJ
MSRGLDCAFHATEIEELEEAIAVSELVRSEAAVPADLPYVRIEHGGVITPDCIDRLAALNAWVVTNPGFIHFRGPKYAEEPGLVPHLYRARSLIAAGVHVAGATDAPVTPAKPLCAIAAAISRATIDGNQLGRDEALSPAEAFGLFTTQGSRLARLAGGEVETDRVADLIVLPRDPAAVKAADLMNLNVDITIVAGRVAYERGRPAVASSDSADLRSG